MLAPKRMQKLQTFMTESLQGKFTFIYKNKSSIFFSLVSPLFYHLVRLYVLCTCYVIRNALMYG